jgi:hypothetical protein
MGALKNQLIAEQVEVGDRIPAPKPATSHVAFPERRLQRKVEREFRGRLKRDMAQIRNSILSAYVLGALTVGAVWMIVTVA